MFSQLSRARLDQSESDAADEHEIVGDAAATALGGGEQAGRVGRDDVDAAEPFAPAVAVCDETDSGVLEPKARSTARLVRNRKLEDLAPPLCEKARIRCLDLGRRDRAHDVGPDRGMPVPSRRLPRTVRVLSADLLVDLQEAAAGIARM